MLSLSDNLQQFINDREGLKNSLLRIIIEPEEIDLTSFIFNRGSIDRELIFQDGIYRPASHSFTITNTKDLGDYLFTLRKNYGKNTWLNKTYRIEYGNLNETIVIYRGKINSRVEDRISETIQFNSSDILKDILDYKICKLVNSSDVFDFSSSLTDVRSFEISLKYGKHLLSTKGSKDSQKSSNALICQPNIVASAMKGATRMTDVIAPYYLWFVPIPFPFQIITLFKAYYWNYISETWEVTYPIGYKEDTTSPFFLYIPTSLTVHGDTWAQYLSGSGSYFNVGTDKAKPNICIEIVWTDNSSFTSTSVNQNPVLFVYDLLRRYVGISADNFDISGKIDTIADSYTWNYAYNKLETDGVKINTQYSGETSVFQIIQDIGKLCGFQLFSTADFNSSTKRNLKISIEHIANSCLPTSIQPLEISTADTAQTFDVELNTNELYDMVQASNYQEGTSDFDTYDVFTVGTGKKVLALNDSTSPKVYFYNLHNIMNVVLLTTFKQYSNPIESINTETDSSSLALELGDYVWLHDSKINERLLARVINISFDLENKIGIRCRRYAALFGPDNNNIAYKRWAFCGCAFAGTDTSGGFGSHVSISLGSKTLTLSHGEIWSGALLPDMLFRCEDEILEIESVDSANTATVKIAASLSHSNASWSAGIGYFAR